ncbi:MAG: hypothetical protein A3E01_09320 [Gammaproteobacteria bacterium RIFCSPHIGHO2_12_FULL_63_22]|nr:MAG: hypothetical protein A3E01_09320 [Gammaproteobacteria bacterium RIFCSPHIGHO2_12_FULL_63_22]
MSTNVVDLNAWRHNLQMGDKGPKRNLTNLMVHLRNLPSLGKTIKLNEMTGITEWRGDPITDTDYVDIQMIIEQASFQPNKNDIPIAVARIAKDNAYHPVRDYLDGLQWDNVTRLDQFLPILFGTPDTPYERMIGVKWMIGAVARVYQPGCKMDNMLVLEGPQNIGKSSALAALFGRQFFTEMVNELRDHKKFMEQIAGKWVVEFAELSAIRRADVELVKAIISMQVDRSRMSYGRNPVENPRQCVLAASVNPKHDSGYLTDPTGNRRFWPVRCSSIDIARLIRKRDDLWAEAVVRYRSGEKWWLDDDEAGVAGGEQSERMAVDPWADVLSAKLVAGYSYTSVAILTEMIKVPTDRLDQFQKTRLADVMTFLGWKQHVAKRRGDGGNRVSVREWRMSE